MFERARMMFKPLVCVAFALSVGVSIAPHLFAADGIRRVVKPDGTIEYTNVGAGKSSAPAKRSAKTEAIYKYRKDDGVIMLTNVRPKKGIEYETFTYRSECYACQPRSKVNWNSTPINTTAYQQAVANAAQEFGVDPALIRAVIHAESAFNVNAKSHQGAQGLMQLMPATADYLGVDNAYDANQNIRGGAQYLAELLSLYQGDIRRATAAYNAGPGAVNKYGGIPPYAETQAYVERVGILHKRYQKAVR
jgi:soluble lytic murein transglycosylase-like protein